MKSHGHIHQRKDGTTEKCGGPTFCVHCAREALLALEGGTLSRMWMEHLSLWTLNRLLKTGVDRRV